MEAEARRRQVLPPALQEVVERQPLQADAAALERLKQRQVGAERLPRLR